MGVVTTAVGGASIWVDGVAEEERADMNSKGMDGGEILTDVYYDILAVTLSQLGGQVAVRPEYDPYVTDIAVRGKLFTGKRIRCPGIPNDCHVNASRLFLRSGGRLKLCTGYALTTERIWLQHSWCLTSPRGNKRRIVETTCEWLKYFGIILDGGAAVKFACNEVSSQEDLRRFVGRYPGALKLVKRVVTASTRSVREPPERKVFAFPQQERELGSRHLPRHPR